MSLDTLKEHRRRWANKPVLAKVYRPWFAMLLARTPPGARVLEVGAGPGFLAEEARRHRPDLRLVTMDVLKTPWNDVVGDALRLPIAGASVDAIVGLDFVHHLSRPASFFREAARVLVPQGELRVVEPWVTILSFPIYRWLHQEGCRPRLDPWDPFGHGARDRGKDAFEGDAAVVSKLVRSTPVDRWRELGLTPPRARPLNAFAYLLSLGFKASCLLPEPLTGPLLALDEAANFAAPLLGLRAFVLWKKP